MSHQKPYVKTAERAIEASKNPDNHFMQDVIADVGVSRPTFYKYVKTDSEEYEQIMENLLRNRSILKRKMRKDWSKNGHPTLQVSLMKMIGTDEERRALSQSHVDIESGGKPINTELTEKLSTATLLELAKAYKQAQEGNKDN